MKCVWRNSKLKLVSLKSIPQSNQLHPWQRKIAIEHRVLHQNKHVVPSYKGMRQGVWPSLRKSSFVQVIRLLIERELLYTRVGIPQRCPSLRSLHDGNRWQFLSFFDYHLPCKTSRGRSACSLAEWERFLLHRCFHHLILYFSPFVNMGLGSAVLTGMDIDIGVPRRRWRGRISFCSACSTFVA